MENLGSLEDIFGEDVDLDVMEVCSDADANIGPLEADDPAEDVVMGVAETCLELGKKAGMKKIFSVDTCAGSDMVGYALFLADTKEEVVERLKGLM